MTLLQGLLPLFFSNKSSFTRLGLLYLLKIGESKFSFWLLNLQFQLWIDVRKKVYFGYFNLKLLVAAYVLLLYVYFLTSSLARESLLILHGEPCFPFFLLKLASLLFTVDIPAAATFLFILINFGLPAWDVFFLFICLVKYERKCLVAKIPIQHKISVSHSTHW